MIKEETDEEQLWADISSVVGSALDKFIAMRETEGAALKADVLEKADVIEDMVSKVENDDSEESINAMNRAVMNVNSLLQRRIELKRR